MVKPISKPANRNRPKVSVAMITYNHERFIAQAIESVLNQKMDFEVELVIGEDCSTDSTRQLVQVYASKYPDVIRALLPEKNLGMQRNFAGVMDACGGDYIAILEGDDYWTDPRKLARQVEFLESDSDCALCFHNAVLLEDESAHSGSAPGFNENGSQFVCGEDTKLRFSQKDFFAGQIVPTCSVMFRREAVGKLPVWFEELSIGDLPLFVLCTEHGLASYTPEVMAAYRQHAVGSWSGASSLDKVLRRLNTLEVLEQYLQSRPHSAVIEASQKSAARAIAKTRSTLELTRARQWLDDGSPEKISAAIWQAWRHDLRQFQWFFLWLLASWPRVAGGKLTAVRAHRKLRERF